MRGRRRRACMGSRELQASELWAMADSSERLLGGAQVVGGRVAAPPRNSIATPPPGVIRTDRQRSSWRRPWQAAPGGLRGVKVIASTGCSCCNRYLMMLQ
ncbi:hypothetical protein PVAP13_7NG255034 [Panicum virgatum]|uniref:Uncharacterized protein n=1 Tax=Panicum virgatum TaxID=38727 RepID=A0A8T0Q8D4_PANVG|nr:hypothetical protein PVAP13_7NG255034 [Panicum virgatum]